jgi:tetratricopeptide (TPR) repeat protein
VRGEEEFRRVMELGPASVEAVYHYALCLGVLCRFDEAVRVAARARQLDPLSAMTNKALGMLLYSGRQDERALAQYRKAIELDPENATAHFFLATLYERAWEYDKAVAAYLKAARLEGNSPELLRILEKASGADGLRAYYRKGLEALKEKARRQHTSPMEFASIYTRLGEKEGALERLEKAYQQHALGLAWVKADREWDPMRSDPRFQDLLRRMNFPQ